MKYLSSQELRQVQMSILDVIDKFCGENNITYYLTGGTLIGAIRHKGYIPWDDDIDIVMYRDEYERFIKIFNESQTRYQALSIEHTPGYNYHFCKVCDMGTVLEEVIRVNDAELGVYVDVFPLDKLPDDVNQEKLLKKLHLLDKMMYCKSFRWSKLKKRTMAQRVKILIGKLLFIFVSRKYLGNKQSQIAQKFANDPTEKYGLITCQIRKHIPRLDRGKTKVEKHIFEDRQYCIPSTYDEYLTTQFGDYMTPPPPEGRTSGHTFVAYNKQGN